MKIYSHDDSEIKPVLDKISKYTKQAKVLGFPYWVFMEDADPIGIVVVGQEPVQLIEPPGTRLAILQIVDFEQSREKIRGFTSQALEFAIEQDIQYALVYLPFEEREATEEFKAVGFKGFDDSYQMVCQLDKPFQPSSELKFHRVQRDEMRNFIKFASRFLQGSPDVTLNRMLQHLLEVPDDFLDLYFGMERFILANMEDKTVGVLSFNPHNGLVSNIGVDTKQRGKGYGRQIMLFALNQLKNEGCEQARLRVHVENEPAIHLYQSLGFKKKSRFKTLIWRKG